MAAKTKRWPSLGTIDAVIFYSTKQSEQQTKLKYQPIIEIHVYNIIDFNIAQ